MIPLYFMSLALVTFSAMIYYAEKGEPIRYWSDPQFAAAHRLCFPPRRRHRRRRSVSLGQPRARAPAAGVSERRLAWRAASIKSAWPVSTKEMANTVCSNLHAISLVLQHRSSNQEMPADAKWNVGSD